MYLTVAMLAALLFAPPAAIAADPVPGADFTLTLLHNNDGESQLINAGSGLEDFGGVARFKTLVDGLRADAEANGNGVLMLSSGDNFLAGPEFNASLENGIPFYDALAIEAIGYDAISLGNHDFDFGPDVLVDFLSSYSSTPQYLVSNMDFTGEPGLQAFVDSGVIAPSTVVTAGGEQIGIIGAITPGLATISSPRNSVINFDVAGAIQAEIDTLTASGVNKIVVISHLQGIDEDIALAAQLTGVDVMIAGGGDELLANDGDALVPGEEGDVFGPYPLTATGADGASIPVVTTPGEYKYVGQLSVGFDADGNVVGIGTDSGPKVVDGTLTPDAGLQASVVDPVVAAIATLDATVIGTSEVALDGTRTGVRGMETNEGNLIADALRWQATELADAFGVSAPDVAIQNGGGIRNNTVIPAGDITVLDTFDMVPFPNFVTVFEGIPRGQFKEILENAYSQVPGGGRFAQISGFSVVYDPFGLPMETDAATGDVTQVGNRIVDVELDDGTKIVEAGSVVAGPPVSIATIDFLARGGDQYPYRGAPFTVLGVSYQQALASYIADGLGGTITAADYPEGGEGRIATLAAPTDFGLVIHHNNDGESQLINAGSGLEDFGGVARFAEVLDVRRRIASNSRFGEILLSSGDNFLAGPEFNASLEKGVPFYDTIAMDLLGYDAIAIGNHDFDFGPDVLADFIEGYSDTMPPYVSANLDFSGEPRLQELVDDGRIVKSTVITERGVEIGIVGATTPQIDFISSPRNVDVLDNVAELVQAEVDALTAAGVNIIIFISHLQDIDEDVALAAELSGVDVMIAGGGDELLANDGDELVPGEEGDVFGPYPIVATDSDGNMLPVVTTPGEYKYLGELWIGFDPTGAATSWAGRPIVVKGPQDQAVFDAAVAPVVDAVATLDATVIGTSEVALDGTRTGVRGEETNEGNLIADALLWQATQLAAGFGVSAPDVALQNGGGIRNNTVLPAGDITVLDTFDMVPFPNFVTVLEGIPRDQFKEILENAYSQVPGAGRFAQVAGFSVEYDRTKTAQVLNDDGTVDVAGERIISVTLDDGTAIVENGAVVAGDPLTIATIDFLARGGDQYPYRGAPFTALGVTYQQALANYITDGLGGTITAADYPEGGEGRITDVGVDAIEGPFTPIYEIQGSGDASPLDGELVEVTGVVTGVFPGLGGFFLQDATGDGDPATSDGIFVESNSVSVGDLVDVRATVAESFDETRLVDVAAVETEGTGSVDATPVSLPLAEGTTLEQYEGMLVTFPDPLTVTDTFNLHRFGEAVLAAGGVLVNPTDVAEPGDAANALAAENAARQIVLDDGSGDQFPDEVPYFADDGTIRRGDAATGITATVSFSFGNYKLQPTAPVTFERLNPRPAAPDDVGGTVKVASFNVLNFFSTIDDGDNGARGADSEAEKAAQLAKLVAAIEGLDADIIGLQEIENNGPTAIGELIDALNASAGAGTWAAAADPEYPGGLEATNAIKVAIIFKPGSVTPVGTTEVSEDPVFGADRPPIAHAFTANGDTFTVINNHFKSKSSRDAEGPDLDQGDGQGAYNARRTAQAAALLDFTLEMVFQTNDGDVLVLGDFNSYAMEDPIATLEGAGFLSNLVKRFLTPEDSYSLVFFGAQGLLDGAFATVPLNEKVTGLDIWHINADEPRVLQYNDDVVDPAERDSDFNQPVSQPDVYSSSDHDPIVIGLDLGGTMQVASGLLNPRHLNWGPDGTLYVAEAGAGGDGPPCVEGPEGDECFGLSGAVTAITADGASRIAGGLPSLAEDGFAAGGPQDVAVAADGTVRALLGLGRSAAARDELLTPAGGGALGQIVNLGADGSATPVLDVAAYEDANNPDGGEIDSNPNALLHVDTGYLIADAGANAVLHFDGTALTTLAVFPDRLVPAPPFVPADEIPMQSVPTSVAVGPDGAYYVGELTGFPFPQGGAQVYRVDPATGDVTVYADGFTNIVDLEFGPNGELYVVQISSSSLLTGELDGAVVRHDSDGSRTVFLDGLFAPTGIAVDQSTGDVYVANCGICPGFGEVLKVAGQAPSPISLGYSTTRDRANPEPLSGATVSGTIYAFVLPVDPGLGFTTVDLYLDGELSRTEYLAPYDFRGGLLTLPTGWNTAEEADGTHTMRAVGNLPDGSTIETSATFTISNAPLMADFTLAVSGSPFRTDPVPLDGATVFGDVYAFIDPLFPDGYEAFTTVDFFINGEFFHTEYAAPYDAVSGGTEKANEALDTTTLPDGINTMTARANRAGGPPIEATATFTVGNGLGDIVDIAAADGRFTTLVAAVQAAGLEATLRSLGPWTVLAPTDDAFAALPEGTLDALLADPAALANVLTYHVLAGAVDSATVAGLSAATTVQGSDITIEVVDGEVILNGTVKVIITDIRARNGIIHVIDGVLIPPPDVTRFATFNASLNRSNAGDLIADLSTPDNEQAQAVAEIIQRVRPEVLLVNEFDYDADGEAARLFQENYLSVSQNGAEPIVYDYAFSAPFNTGVASGLDLDNDGEVGGPNDAFGFGFFEGQFGMQVFSQHPIDFANVRTFQNFLWADMPGALLPFDPATGQPWYSQDELGVVRLSSKSHWDVPIMMDGGVVNFLVSHPTPPVFDGPEDRNGTRNHDEIRFWSDYVNGAEYIYDDNGTSGGWDGDYFVIAGDQNADPFDGDSQPGAAQLLLDNPRVNTSMTPSSLGGSEQAILQGSNNADHLGDPAHDTADFGEAEFGGPGNLRVDYVLPSANLDIVDSGVFWPEEADPAFSLVGTFPFPSSDHRLVWVDLSKGATPLPPPSEPEMVMSFEVTVENLTSGQPFTPVAAASHDPSVDLFDVGDPANLAIQELAENGNLSEIFAFTAASLSQFSGAFVDAGPLVPAADPGGTGLPSSTTFSLTAAPGDVLTAAFMLICTNDGFSGVDSIPLPFDGETVVINAMAYDAGTENNTEDFVDMVPPCPALTGVATDKTGTGASNPALAEGGVITAHSGITGAADLQPDFHGWEGAVARITIEKVDAGPPSIFDIASNDDRFDTLTAALELSGLDMALDGDGPFTVFAPTDDAFDALPPGLLDELLGDPGFLEAALLFHVTEGALTAADLEGLTEVVTLLGAPASVEVIDGVLVIDGVAEVVVSDIMASNGIIHVIDAVLLPPPPPQPLGFIVADWARGTAEVPAIEGSSSLSAAFVDVFALDDSTYEFCFFVNTSVANPVAAHIHRGVAGENGPVVVNTGFDAASFTPDDLVPSDRFAEGCVPVERTLGDEILATPGAFYFNVHSEEYPGGENREQFFDASMLTGPPIAFTAAPWRGDLVVPGPGDPEANGAVQLTDPTTDTGEWCFSMFISQTGPLTGGQIGAGAPGEASTTLADLQIGSRWPVVALGQQWIVNGCAPVAAADQGAIAADPGSHHVQVATDEFPDGAARATIGAGSGDENVYLAELAPVDGVDPMAGGFTPVVLFPMQDYLCWGIDVNGIGDPTGATITTGGATVFVFDLTRAPFRPGPFAELSSLGCQPADGDVVDGILANPGDYEVVVSNANGPALAGAIFNPQAGPPLGEVPPPRDPDSIPLPNGFQPEGVAIGNGNDIFAGSLVSGAIYKADFVTGIGAPLVVPTDGRTSVGMTVDTRTNYLWVAGGPFGNGFVYDADTGAEMAAIQLNSAAPFETLVNDVIVAGDAAYFTDSFRPYFYRVPLGPGGSLPDPVVVEEIALNTEFPFIPGGINSNGIVVAGDMLLINHTDDASLFAVDPATGSATRVDLGGAALESGDGLVLDGTTLYVVQNALNQIAVVELSADYMSGTLTGTITSPLFRVPTTAAQSDGDLYAVNARFDVAPPPFPGTPPPDPTLDYDIVRVSKDSVTPLPGPNIVASVVKAPIVPDGDVAGAVTDFVINLDLSLDPAVPGRSLAAGNQIRITLPDAFIDNGFDTGAPGAANCMPGPCNIGVLLQGWPQHPIRPPAAKYSLAREGTHTFVYTALEDLGPAGAAEPGIKQMHLILLGFTNPAAGDYDIVVEAQTGPGGTWESGTGTLTIRPAVAPSINVTSVFNDGTPNTIYQTTPAGQPAPLAHDFLLFDATGGPMTGVTLDGSTLMRDGSRVGEVTITAPDGATGQAVTVASPSVEIVGPVLGAPTARLTAVFTAGSATGTYSVTYSLDGGNSVTMFVTATERLAVDLEATLDGASEVPGPGDPDGTGTALVSVEGTTVTWQFTVANIDMPTAAHIHVGAAGVSGGVAVDLLSTGTLTDNGDGTFTAMGTVEADAAVAADIIANPEGYYVNVHNAAFGPGAVRGQLVLVTG